MYELYGKIPLITGGSRGIARAAVVRLAEHGVDMNNKMRIMF